jgi:hypothetical protein
LIAWKGHVRIVSVTIEEIKGIFLREGYVDPTPLQHVKEGQLFGLVKKIGDKLENHVRGFDDNTLHSEIELSRDYLEHPFHSGPFYAPVLEILRRYGIRYELTYLMPRDVNSVVIPKSLTPWKPLMMGIGLLIAVGVIIWLASRHMGEHKRRKASII